MIDITTLKKGDKFYLVDLNYDTCDEDSVTECIVIKKYLKTTKHLLIDAIQYVDCIPYQPVVDNGEGFYINIHKRLEEYMYLNLEDAINHHKEYRRLYELGMNACYGDCDTNWYELGKEIDEKYKDYPDCFADEFEFNNNNMECNECDYMEKCERKINAYYERIGAEVLSLMGDVD